MARKSPEFVQAAEVEPPTPRPLIPHGAAFPGSGLCYRAGAPMPNGARLQAGEVQTAYVADGEGNWRLTDG